MQDLALILIVAVVVLAGGVWYWYKGRQSKTTDRSRYGQAGHYKWGDLPQHQQYPDLDVSAYTTNNEYASHTDANVGPAAYGRSRVRRAIYVTANHASSLERQVNELVSRGFTPVGAPVTTPNLDRFVQLMVEFAE